MLQGSINATYRCNARCYMCSIWQNPTKRAEEFDAGILEKLPDNFDRLCLAGGEPMLRDDIAELTRIVVKKARRPLISTNGYFTDRIVRLCEQYPRLGVRVSIEGLPKLNDRLRGIEDGFDHALRTVLRLKAMGRRDVGLGIVITDRNCADLLDVYTLCVGMGLELADATAHNSFYFHKDDNRIEDVQRVEVEIRRLIVALLSNRRREWRLRSKDWARAYLNLGILHYVQGQRRALPCGAGVDSLQVSPLGLVEACNGSAEPWVMGDLKTQPFDEIWHSPQAEEVRQRVRACRRDCWMTGSAVPAMRRRFWVPAWWILQNKARLALGRDVCFA